MRDIFGDLADDPTYVAAFSSALGPVDERASARTLADYLDNPA